MTIQQLVLPEISRWLRERAEEMRSNHADNSPYAEPYDFAAEALDQGDREPAREIIESHQQNAVNADNNAKYSAWLHHLAEHKSH